MFIVSVILVTLLLGWSQHAPTADERDLPDDGRETEQETLPEHRVRPLPADTFTPSEEISEDFAVPFPVDI